jgi:hypothetical protein
MPKSKYGSRKVTVDGITFDSRKEAARYQELKLLERVEAIKNLQRQVEFELIPSQRINGKVAERPCKYVADFVYLEDLNFKSPDGPIWNKVVEDTKGFKTKDYIIKRKLMLKEFGIRIREV